MKTTPPQDKGERDAYFQKQSNDYNKYVKKL